MRNAGNLIVLAAAVLAATPLGAQESSRSRSRSGTRVRDGFAYSFDYDFNRGRIGVVVSTEADATRDRVGARLEGITPGGPAEKAGLRVGDIVTRFMNTALAGLKAEEEGMSGPGVKLVELARELEPGDTVRIEYRRGNESAKTVTLVAQDLGYAGTPMAVVPDIVINPGWMLHEEGPWMGMQLVPVDSQLGEYFGVREGLLVLKAHSDSTLPLRAGDVILSFDGRKPTSPQHAMRILRSYEAGEQVVLEVQRKQRRQSVTWTVPEREEHWRMLPRRAPSPARAPRAPRQGSEES